ncbi:hypothetical protein TCAL_14440 [Tigriopus californicus]|uniref:Uncharacterized protein n=1 Tax=Tigriopus californicus TaxID=6832 RepID=A0A553PKK5_TIGCA|nr:hypothetical protein TCAL_14440 [Tigriopus californicus]
MTRNIIEKRGSSADDSGTSTVAWNNDAEDPDDPVIKKSGGAFKLLHKLSLFFVCSGALVYLSYLSIHRYALRETATADKYLHISEVAFPEITLCPSNPYKLDILKRHGIRELRDIQFNAQWISSIQPDLEPTEFMDAVNIPLDEIFHSVSVDTEKPLANRRTQSLLNGTLIGACQLTPIWKIRDYYFNGICFSLQLPRCLLKLGILEMSVRLHQSTDVFIHHPDQFLSPNSRNRVKLRTPVSPSRTMHFKIAATYEIVELDSRTGKCFDYSDSSSVGFDQCMYDILYEMSLNEVNCTVPWLPKKDRICVDAESRSKAFTVYQNNRRNQFGFCETPCAFTNVFFGPPVEELGYSSNQEGAITTGAELVIYFRRDVKVTLEYFLVSGISLIAEIGGYASLLLGFSLFNLTDLADFVFAKVNRFFRGCSTASIAIEPALQNNARHASSALH